MDWNKYGKDKSIWMLFPDPKSDAAAERKWFLVPHNVFYQWVQARHAHTPKWNEAWSYPGISKDLGEFLEKFTL